MQPERLEPVREHPSLVVLHSNKPSQATSSEAAKPSPLLSRLKTFLPELAEANKKLESETVDDEILVKDENKGELNERGDEQKKGGEEGVVEMSLYVDNTLGELVGGNGEGSNIEEVQGNVTGKRKRDDES